MITLALLSILALPLPQARQNAPVPKAEGAVPPDQVLAWQLEGLTPEEIRDEVERRGLTQCPEIYVLTALRAARMDEETVRAMQHAKAPCPFWRLGLRMPGPTDYLYEIAGAIQWNDFDDALNTAQNETTKQPRNPEVHLVCAHLLRMQQDWIAAYGEATIAVTLAPQSPYVHGLRSTICYHSRLPQCAIHDAVEFVKQRHEDAAAYIVLGHANELLGRDDQALMAYAEASRLHPEYAESHAGLGRIHARQGEFENAVAAFREAIRLDSRNAEFYADLAALYQAEGYNRQSIENWRKAKELEPDRTEIALALGNAYLLDEQYPEAEREYRELLLHDPDMENAKGQLARVLRVEGRGQEAEQILADPLETAKQEH